MKSMIFVLVLATLVVYIEAHGKMVNPPARGSVWRFFPGDAPRSNVDSEWCFQHLFGENNTTRKDHSGRDSTCGVCGPIYGGKPNTPRNITLPNFGSSIVVPGHSYEASTRFGFAKTGKIVKTYKRSVSRFVYDIGNWGGWVAGTVDIVTASCARRHPWLT